MLNHYFFFFSEYGHQALRFLSPFCLHQVSVLEMLFLYKSCILYILISKQRSCILLLLICKITGHRWLALLFSTAEQNSSILHFIYALQNNNMGILGSIFNLLTFELLWRKVARLYRWSCPLCYKSVWPSLSHTVWLQLRVLQLPSAQAHCSIEKSTQVLS